MALDDSLSRIPDLRRRMAAAADSVAASRARYDAAHRADSSALALKGQQVRLYMRSFDKQGELTQAARTDATKAKRGRNGWRIVALVLGTLLGGSIFVK